MAFDIKEFHANLKTGFASTAHFECLLTGVPNSLWNDGRMKDLAFKITAANLPGKSVQTTDYKYHGPLRKVPYSYINNELTLTVLCSPDYKERDYFMNWMNAAVGDTHSDARFFQGAFKKVNYYKEICGTLEIRNFGKDKQVTRVTKFHEVFPLNINEIALSWGEDQIAQFTVGLQYYAFTESNTQAPDPRKQFRQVAANLGGAFG